MEIIRDIDKVLKHLSKKPLLNSTKFIKYEFKDSIEPENVVFILDKLVLDKLATSEFREHISDFIYTITWEGYLFILEGGYFEKYQNQDEEKERLIRIEQQTQRNAKSMTLLTGILAIASITTAIYYTILIVEHFRLSKPLI